MYRNFQRSPFNTGKKPNAIKFSTNVRFDAHIHNKSIEQIIFKGLILAVVLLGIIFCLTEIFEILNNVSFDIPVVNYLFPGVAKAPHE